MHGLKCATCFNVGNHLPTESTKIQVNPPTVQAATDSNGMLSANLHALYHLSNAANINGDLVNYKINEHTFNT